VAAVVAEKSETGGSVGLGIAIDQEYLEAFESETGRKVDGSGGLANSAFLIHDSKNLSHGLSEYREGQMKSMDLHCGEPGEAVESVLMGELGRAVKPVQGKRLRSRERVLIGALGKSRAVENSSSFRVVWGIFLLNLLAVPN
jgi:hypothetical protein